RRTARAAGCHPATRPGAPCGGRPQGRRAQGCDTTAGHTTAGDTTAGDTAAGDTAAGDTAAGDTAAGHAGAPQAAAPVAAAGYFAGEGAAVSAPGGGRIVFTAFMALVLTVLPLPPWPDVLRPVFLVLAVLSRSVN